MITFHQYNVTDDAGHKARVHYSINNRRDGRECVTIYAKDYRSMRDLFPSATNGSDYASDYVVRDKVVIYKGDEHYAAALAAARKADAAREARHEAIRARQEFREVIGIEARQVRHSIDVTEGI